jgi:16S rRNA (cytosine1402-N4)-methyltransferase
VPHALHPRRLRHGLELLRTEGFEADLVYLDLGMSSMQVDTRERGFSYAYDAPLDMRMDPAQELTAAEIVNTWERRRLARTLREYGEERYAERIAAEIVRRRPLSTTFELGRRHHRRDPAPARFGGGHPGQADVPGDPDPASTDELICSTTPAARVPARRRRAALAAIVVPRARGPARQAASSAETQRAGLHLPPDLPCAAAACTPEPSSSSAAPRPTRASRRNPRRSPRRLRAASSRGALMAARTAGRRTPHRPRRARRATARISGRSPAQAPARARRDPRAVTAFFAVRALPDHRVIDRLLRGRVWICFIGVALMGIVAMQVSLLKLNSGISRAVETTATLERQNSDMEASIARLASGERIRAPPTGGMVTPAAGDVHYLRVRRRTDAAWPRAAMRAPSDDAQALMANHGVVPGVADAARRCGRDDRAAPSPPPAATRRHRDAGGPRRTPVPTPAATVQPTTVTTPTTTAPTG